MTTVASCGSFRGGDDEIAADDGTAVVVVAEGGVAAAAVRAGLPNGVPPRRSARVTEMKANAGGTAKNRQGCH